MVKRTVLGSKPNIVAIVHITSFIEVHVLANHLTKKHVRIVYLQCPSAIRSAAKKIWRREVPHLHSLSPYARRCLCRDSSALCRWVRRRRRRYGRASVKATPPTRVASAGWRDKLRTEATLRLKGCPYRNGFPPSETTKLTYYTSRHTSQNVVNKTKPKLVSKVGV